MSHDAPQKEPTSHPVWRGVKITLGFALLLLGVVGLLVPVLQGFLFIILALAILSREVPLLGRYEDMMRERYPQPWIQAERVKRRVQAWYRRRFGNNECSGEGDS